MRLSPCFYLATLKVCTIKAHFKHGYDNFQYLLGDPSYTKAEMFILCCIGANEHLSDVPQNTIDEFNKMHASYRTHVKWDIRGLK